MAKFTTFIGYTNVVADEDGRRYLSGIVHPTAAQAVAQRANQKLVGDIVGVAQISWDEPENPPGKPWTKKT
jgi:hypothetical protein